MNKIVYLLIMAVFSKISRAELEEFIKKFNLGTLESFEGIRAGIENTNYFVNTSAGQYVLTIFEKLTYDQASFYLRFMLHLANKKTVCPKPILSESSNIIHSLYNKPAALVTRLGGFAIEFPNDNHCFQLGKAVAQTHDNAWDFQEKKNNCRGFDWWQTATKDIFDFLTSSQQKLIKLELSQQEKFRYSEKYKNLPKAMIHADLFKDNVLFTSDKKNKVTDSSTEKLSGLIDFYFAGYDCLVYDLAIALNDWAISTKDDTFGSFRELEFTKLIAGYESVRLLSADEKECLPMMLRGAALRFWISRLFDWHKPRDASLISPKNPSQFEVILNKRREECN